MSRYYEFKREDAENFKTHVGAMARNFGEEMIFATVRTARVADTGTGKHFQSTQEQVSLSVNVQAVEHTAT